jgi:hypothetical protein
MINIAGRGLDAFKSDLRSIPDRQKIPTPLRLFSAQDIHEVGVRKHQ